MERLEGIADVFNIFHDGYIESYTTNADEITLEVCCVYLAEVIDPSFEHFYVKLVNLEHLSLDVWEKDDSKRFTDSIDEICSYHPEFLSASVKNDMIEMVSAMFIPNSSANQGLLKIRCASIRVYDQQHRELSMLDLEEICKKYRHNQGR